MLPVGGDRTVTFRHSSTLGTGLGRAFCQLAHARRPVRCGTARLYVTPSLSFVHIEFLRVTHSLVAVVTRTPPSRLSPLVALISLLAALQLTSSPCTTPFTRLAPPALGAVKEARGQTL